MDITSEFVIYLLVFRVAIIIASIVCIVLGYRLFVRGVWPGETEVSAQIAKQGFTIKNAAPGTCFALFGAVVLVVMFFKGAPELTLDLIRQSGQPVAQDSSSVDSLVVAGSIDYRRDQVTMRGQGSTLQDIVLAGREFERRRDTTRAIEKYEEAVGLFALPANNLAWMYYKQGRIDEAYTLSNIAVQLKPTEANYLDTKAHILYERGEYDKALTLMQEAVRLAPRFRQNLAKFEEAVQ